MRTVPKLVKYMKLRKGEERLPDDGKRNGDETVESL
jgi:hypothetical protein